MSDLRDKVMSDLDDVVRSEQTGNRWVMSAAQAALDEIASLRAQLEQSRTSKSYQKDRAVKARRAQQDLAQGIDYWRERADKAEAQLACARKALELYADESNWHFNQRFDPNSSRFNGVSTAQTALTDENGK